MNRLHKTLVYLGVISSCTLLFSCGKLPKITDGVSEQLASWRKQHYDSIAYTLSFNIPAQQVQSVTGTADISVNLLRKQPIYIDFRGDSTSIKAVSCNGKLCKFVFSNGHLTIPADYTHKGKNSVGIEFIAGNGSLNRSEEFLYTLLVPDRASTVFPCFDQPNLKAQFTLSLTIPITWTAMSNGKLNSQLVNDSTHTLNFHQTKPISTYLFAFTAGIYDTLTFSKNGRTLTMFHRETDAKKVEQNAKTIADAHFNALSWLEEYTGIPYPFHKLDIALIPDFQYGGMEHAGAIFYRDSRLMLNPNPSINQQLSQQNLIAHEVAHQWFGNLVTMSWFNDVWLKEVFAGLFADKIVNPMFPEINHQLSFMLSHHPRAYSVDRTQGANPIRQELENLLYAGTLYGDIIYHKSPVMMQQLEMLLGETAFRKGMQNYLTSYTMGNATWENLVAILDKETTHNLKEWSNAWVYQSTMPTINSNMQQGSATVNQVVDMNLLPMPMIVDYLEVTKDTLVQHTIEISNNKQQIPLTDSTLALLPNATGIGYGRFSPDSTTLAWILANPNLPANETARASQLVMLYELYLDAKVNQRDILNHLLSTISAEKNAQIRQYALNTLSSIYWRTLPAETRNEYAPAVELVLMSILDSSSLDASQKRPVLNAFISMALTPDGINRMYGIWNSKADAFGVALTEDDFTSLALTLALKDAPAASDILKKQELRITNPDRLKKFLFVSQAASASKAERDQFFASLANAQNRKPEPWVTEALHLLNHPLRANDAIGYLKPSLDLLPEIQRTGDIFFPKMWLDEAFWGHSSPEAKRIVEQWLEENKNVSANLRGKVLQSANFVLRLNASK